MRNIFAMFCLLLASHVGQAQTAAKSTAPPAPPPAPPQHKKIVLSTEDELKMRRLWKPATEASIQLKEQTDQFQRQLESQPFYRALKDRAQATSNAYTAAASEILRSKGCEGCRFAEEKNGAMYLTDETPGATPVVTADAPAPAAPDATPAVSTSGDKSPVVTGDHNTVAIDQNTKATAMKVKVPRKKHKSAEFGTPPMRWSADHK